MFITTALECPHEGTPLHVAQLSSQPTLLNMVKQLLQEATDESNPSEDTSPSQGGWYCGITPATTGEGSAQKQPVPATGMLQAPGRYREASPIEPQLPEKADDKPKTSAPLRRQAFIPDEEQRNSSKTSIFRKGT